MDPRLLHQQIIIGTIDSVSEDARSARVRIGEIVTDFRPLPAAYGQNYSTARPVHENALCVLNCPSGDLDASIIIGVLWTGSHVPYRIERHIDGVKFNDGTTVEYDSQTKQLSISTEGDVIVNTKGKALVQSQTDIELASTGKLRLYGEEVIIHGPVTQIGGDITSDGVSVQKHKHTETGSLTEKPL